MTRTTPELAPPLQTPAQHHQLNTYNSVFQTELAAIEFAANWAVKEKVKVNIYTDSLSSISAINSANTRSGFINKVKPSIFKAKNMVGFPGLKPMWEFLETNWPTNKPNWP
ncbi:hypothetical protein AVEN_161141-1 [Araneus ventricosus]|uniref:RNase H type-1 domain-containing protein n=1 Tax=Araneus ventricosus TaxID=182803 RepID=A0A4Y2HE88_ARAVE|nr:hypothetical protein AVEN_228974-1 [Araneus ventricosus]GBM63582.1 hypothetical protein AVEN_254607-1 [Araneus ventricosus]GBM63620.1 hypothetical protein AVEN_117694-1 [Araneus ventricosus]GBM63641.1 hypothetical protein AVEN_161141-1 [Araneus ventricosus]